MIFHPMADDRKVRAFSLSPSFLDQFKGKQPNWGPVGYFTYKRTYARDLPDGTTEEFWQTCKRVVEGCFNIQKIHCRQMGLPWTDQKAQASAQDMFKRMWAFKFTPPGRGLWMMGTDLVYERGSAALQNCAFVSTEKLIEDFSSPFCFLMDMSMLGVGVGGDTRGSGKVRIQMPKISTEPHVVADSREGWVDLVRTVLNSFVGKGTYPAVIDYSKVRGRGTPIKTFGGTASGPKPLHGLIENLTRLLMPVGVEMAWEVAQEENWSRIQTAQVFFKGTGEPRRITSSQIVDIFNFIGKAVVAGGVRRTAEIMFGDPDDAEFITLKQDMDALSDRRWASNNSVFGYVGMDYTEIARSMAVNGEPGIFWVDNARMFSRMGHPADNKDFRVMGTNPCGEQPLESFELCNLVETYPAHHDTYEDFERTLKMAYLYAKTVTLVPTHDIRANAVMMRNRRIGCSMSGIIQAMGKLGRRQFLQWCDRGYNYVQHLDRIYCDWLCVPQSIKTTTVKPSGTVSLLCGASPGIHYPHSEYYIRRIRVQGTSPLIQACLDAGYEVEKDSYADDTMVVSFPVHEEHFVKGKEQATVWEQFSNAAALQNHWTDNQVSITVTFKPKEVDDLKACLEMFEDKIKAISVLPLADGDHGYVQPPYEAITKERYEAMIEHVKPLVFDMNTHESEDNFCSGDKCLIPQR